MRKSGAELESSPEHAFVTRAWYLAAWSDELRDTPLARRICGQDIALFRTRDGTARAIAAVCPHRGANLAQGRVVDGTLQCPFHGWRFDATGSCVRVPSQPEALKIPPGAAVASYPLREQQGCLWIWPSARTEPREPAPRYEIFDEQRAIMRLPTRVIRAPLVSVVENALDESHIHFLHQKTLGVKCPLAPRLWVARDPDGRGITARWDPDSSWGQEHFELYARRPGLLGWLLEQRYGRFDARLRTWSFRLGGVVLFREVFQRGRGHAVVLSAATPIDADSTGFTSAMAHPLLGSRVAKSLATRIGNALIDEDRLGTEGLLHHSHAFSHPVSVLADQATLAFRQLYAEALRQEDRRLDRSA